MRQDELTLNLVDAIQTALFDMAIEIKNIKERLTRLETNGN